MQADTLAGLLRTLDMAPAIIMGGSGGSRVSLLTAVRHPDVTAKLAMVWISGGIYGLLLLAVHYCGESVRAAWQGGMEAVVELPEWAEVLERNPRNRDLFLALDPQEFIETLERWMLVYCPAPGSTVPGVTDAELARLVVPTSIFRSGVSDPHHTRATSERLHELISGFGPRRAAVARRRVEATGRGGARTAPGTCSNAGRCSPRSSSTSRRAATPTRRRPRRLVAAPPGCSRA